MIFLVTGGRGFIGSHFVEKILGEGHEVIDIDKMTYAANENLPWDKDSNYALIKSDICDIEHLPICDIIVNFAAESHVDNSIESPKIFLKSNVDGVFNILSLLRAKVYQKPLFVHISTDEVYGDANEETKQEDSILNPSNPYSATKAAAEMLIFAYARTFGIDYQIVRSTNNYGPRQYPEKLVPKIIHSLDNNEKIPLHGDGSYVRDWLYVKDNVSAIYKICQAKKLCEIWNVSAYNYMSNIEVVKKICDWKNIENFMENVSFVEDRMGQDYRYSISSKKIRDALGWIPEKKDLFNFIDKIGEERND
jgi:dTDP-glucose 4,6-dehydratase